MELFDSLRGIVGIAALLGLAWAFSENRRLLPGWRWMLGALALQGLLAVLIVRVPAVWAAVGLVNDAVSAIEAATLKGSAYMFGYLGGAELPFALKEGAQPPLVIAFQILPLVIVFSALSALLWHWGVLRWMVNGLSFLLRRSLGVSGVVGLSGGASVFLGVVEAPLVTRAYFARVSRSELFQIMTLTMATISGAILILYATTLRGVVPDAVGHMISASLISLPAALLIARLMVPPGDGDAATAVDAEDTGLRYESSIDAIVKGTMDGMQLFLAVIAVIITVFALVALADMALAATTLTVEGEPLTLRRLLGWALAPLMWLIGVPWAEAQAAGGLMGTKAVLNEYVAYLELAALPSGTLGPRSLLIVTYALCGVANLASVGLLVSTIGTLAPERRAEAAGLGMKSWISGNLASAMTGAWIGLVTW
ncbi:MAG: nucleoside:proton symporter [Porphyrobacter sp.]|nr:nucleoside:proton symporter [Porphyrobacter sp.]